MKEIQEAIEREINRRTEAIIEDEMLCVKERVISRVRGEVGSIAATVLQRFSFEIHRNELLIRVDFGDHK